MFVNYHNTSIVNFKDGSDDENFLNRSMFKFWRA